MHSHQSYQSYFYDLAAFLGSRLQGSEQYKCWFSAESSDFVRFNRSAIRQPGHVRQIVLSLNLIDGKHGKQRHAGSSMSLTGDLDADRMLLDRAVSQLRAQLLDLPEDPYLLIPDDVRMTEHIAASHLPAAGAIVDEVLRAAQGTDMVGLLAAGPLYRGFANSMGQRNWHEIASFNLDWSVYHARDKAVKTSYAGFDWSSDAFRGKFDQAAAQLEKLKREPVTLKPGAYRAYLTPTALNEMIGMLNWDGLSEKALRTKRSALRRMRDDGVQLHPAVTLSENTAGGLAPEFQSDGFIKPEKVPLFEQGKLAGSLISPRTAKEYGLISNGADGSEAMVSMDLAAGEVPLSQVLAELDTGIFISNLWYLNFSDRAHCRLTGMTRFATFWVENGEIQAPLNAMRFDDSLFRMLGHNLIGLTQERELLIDGESYGERRTGSALLPGALVKDMTFVL